MLPQNITILAKTLRSGKFNDDPHSIRNIEIKTCVGRMNLRTIGCRKMISNSLVLDLMSYVRGDSAGENQMGKWKHVSKWSTSVLFICVKCGKEGPAQMKRRCSPCHEAQCHNTWIR